MKLNMQAGQLGIVISGQRSQGRIVKCIRLLEDGEIVPAKTETGMSRVKVSKPSWLLEGFVWLAGSKGSVIEVSAIADAHLRPIRDSDGEDETFTWAGKPEGVTA